MSIPASARRLLDFIASYEAPRGYDTVYGNHMASMPRPLTSMTLDEVIADGPRRTAQYGSSACGRYQFMTATLKDLKALRGLTGRERFDAALQDDLGYSLLVRRGYVAFMGGGSLSVFGLALAKEWASFPVLAEIMGAHRRVARGQSFYAGDGLNKALVRPEAVEQALNEVQSGDFLHLKGDAESQRSASLSAPRAPTVPSPVATLPWWARLLGIKKPAPAATIDRPGLKPNGSAALWDVQKALRDRNYYTKGFLDGLDGGLTQGAVAQARKDNGLGDGGVDAAFLEALKTMPARPVSEERSKIGIVAAARHAPELFKPVAWLGGTGVSIGGLTGFDYAGAFGKFQSIADKGNDILGKAQTGVGFLETAGTFVWEHRLALGIALCAILVLKAVSFALDGVIKVRQAFF